MIYPAAAEENGFMCLATFLGTISYEKHQARLIFVSSVTTVRQVRFADRLAIVYILFQTGITVDTTNSGFNLASFCNQQNRSDQVKRPI